VALVTGGARGQGAAIGAAMVGEGARVVLADVLDEAGRESAEALGQSGTYVHLDVSQEADWVEAVALCSGQSLCWSTTRGFSPWVPWRRLISTSIAG